MDNTRRRRRTATVGIAASAFLAASVLGVASTASASASPGDSAFGQAQGNGWGNLAFPDPTTLTLTETLKGLETGKFTSVDLVKAYLARIEKFEPYYNAFTQMNPNALEDAAASDARRKKGKGDVGALDGVPIVIKDSMDVKGMATTSGWPLTSPITGGISLVPEKDAPVVGRLRDAGAVFLGKTNLPILAGSGNNANNSAYGPTYNALNKAWAPGGSSSGSAMSVAGGFSVTGLAEETGGSIQNPASAESLYAVKPTFGLVPTTGNFPLAGAWRDVIGPLAQSPEDAALMLDVMAGPTTDDPKTAGAIVPDGGYTSQLSTHALEGKRIGLFGPGWRSGSTGQLSPETARLYADAVAKLEAQGATVVEDPFAGSGFAELRTASPSTSGLNNPGIEQYLERLGPSAAVHSVEELNDWADTHGFASDTRINGMLAGAHVNPDLTAVQAYRDQYLRIFNKVMDDNHLDALIYPQQYQEQGPIFGGTIAATTVSEINWAQLPGVVVPDGSYASGKPFNLIIVDKQYSEAEMLGYAYDFAQAYGGRIINHDLNTVPGPTQ
ncbi:amidase family protein [Intrasporangium mesophilum]